MALIDKVAHVMQFRAAMIRMVMAFEVAVVLYDIVEETLRCRIVIIRYEMSRLWHREKSEVIVFRPVPSNLQFFNSFFFKLINLPKLFEEGLW